MKTVQLFLYAAIAIAVAYVLYRIIKLGESFSDGLKHMWDGAKDFGKSISDGVGNAVDKAKNVAGAAVDDVVAGHQNVVNAVSGSFTSSAEDEVNRLYGPQQGWKTETVTRGKAGVGTTKKNVQVPGGADDNSSPMGFNNPDWYNYGAAKNPPAGTVYDVPNVNTPSGAYPRSSAPVSGTNNPSSNNDVIFEQMTYPY